MELLGLDLGVDLVVAKQASENQQLLEEVLAHLALQVLQSLSFLALYIFIIRIRFLTGYCKS